MAEHRPGKDRKGGAEVSPECKTGYMGTARTVSSQENKYEILPD